MRPFSMQRCALPQRCDHRRSGSMFAHSSMYNPAHFEESRPEVLHRLIATHPLGTLVTLASSGLDANHIPFELVNDTGAGSLGTLRAHVARANPVWQDFSRELDALIIFQGPQTYITPEWYTETKP